MCLQFCSSRSPQLKQEMSERNSDMPYENTRRCQHGQPALRRGAGGRGASTGRTHKMPSQSSTTAREPIAMIKSGAHAAHKIVQGGIKN